MNESLGFLIRLYGASCWRLGSAEASGVEEASEVFRFFALACFNMMNSPDIYLNTGLDAIANILLSLVDETFENDTMTLIIEKFLREELNIYHHDIH